MALKDAGMQSAQEIHAFGNFLKRSEDEMTVLIKRIATELNRVHRIWDDDQNRKFTMEFRPYVDQVKKMIEHLDRYSKYVHRKAARIEDYKNER